MTLLLRKMYGVEDAPSTRNADTNINRSTVTPSPLLGGQCGESHKRDAVRDGWVSRAEIIEDGEVGVSSQSGTWRA
jgi:hypothetical protein